MKCSSVCCMGAIESYVTLVLFFFGGVVAVLFRFCSPCQARCLIGRPIADDASAEITFMTEKMFPLKDFERAAFQVETRQVWDLLCDVRWRLERSAQRVPW